MNHAVIFLPWIRHRSILQVGAVRFIPRAQLHLYGISSSALRRQVYQILSQYRLNLLRNDSNSMVATYCDDPLNVGNVDKLPEIMEMIRVLAVASIAENQYCQTLGRYINWSTFEFYTQRFVSGEPGVAFASTRKDGPSTDGGYQYRHLRTTAPSYVRHCRTFGINKDMVSALVSLCSKKPSAFRRLMSSIEWFLLSFTDNPVVSKATEISSMVAAFENLHQSTMNPNLLCSILGEQIRRDPAGTIQNEKARWYHELVGIRNDLLHGTQKTKKRIWPVGAHLFIGAVLYPLVLKRILNHFGDYQLQREDLHQQVALDTFIQDPDTDKWETY